MAANPTADMQVATKQYVDNSALVFTMKTGSGTGDYTTTSSTYTDVDATNLAYTVTIPSGKQIMILATGTCSNSVTTVTSVAIADGTTTLAEVRCQGSPSDWNSPFVLSTVVTGTGAPKTFKLRFRSNGADTAIIRNSSATLAPRLTFIGA
jgi:hypothetical protein